MIGLWHRVMYSIVFSASTKCTKSLFKLSGFWSSMKMVIKELFKNIVLKKKNCYRKNFFSWVFCERGSLVDWNSCAKKVQNMPGIVAMTKVVWKPGNSVFARKCGGNWRKLYRKERYLPCLKEEIISKQMPRDGYTKEQTNTEIPAINPWTTFHTSVGIKAGTAQFP